MGPRVVVLKFGSSVLEGAAGFRNAALDVVREVELGRRVVAVVSATAGTTDALLGSVSAISPRAPHGLVCRLLATGESASVALLAIALADHGVESATLDSDGLGLRTRGPALDADPVDVDEHRLRAHLAERPVLVVPGFVGSDGGGEPSVLGRGGSDLTALFLAHRLGAEECRLVKDVDGIYSADPRTDAAAVPFARMSWDAALEVGGAVVQDKAVRFARGLGMSFRVTATGERGGKGTWVGDAREALAPW